jgi:DNA (cytosine-5)-methyltransferase 1
VFIMDCNHNKIPIKINAPQHALKTVFEAINDLPRLESGKNCNTIPNHTAMKHTEQMLQKMSFIKDGGDRNDIPSEIKPLSGDIRKYIKYDSNKPSHTVTGDMRKIFHYSQNRVLTVRECARIQSFPDDFIFQGTKSKQLVQIGNAVPPNLSKAVGLAILKSFEEN